MKFWILPATIILSLIGGCKKATVKNCVKGKIVRISCASAVIQVLDNNTLGEDGWIDMFGGNNNSYDNVFNLGNKCDLPPNFSTGDIIWFTIEPPFEGGCFVCDMADSPPAIKYFVKNISGIPCQP